MKKYGKLQVIGIIVVLGVISMLYCSTTSSAKSYKKTFRNSNEDFGNYCAYNFPQHKTSAMGVESAGFYRVDNCTDETAYIEPLYRDEISGADKGVVLVEHYDKSFRYVSQTWIPRELPKYGGFYQGSDGYYFFFGKNNPNQNDSSEVWRIVKYDKAWKRVSSASLYGGETGVWDSIAFPNVSFYEYGGLLYIDTNLEGYAAGGPEGNHHQYSYIIVLKTSDMSIVKHGNFQKISHSMRQFILRDRDGSVVVYEQSDGEPERGAILRRFDTSDDETGIYDKSWGFAGETANTLYYGFNENSRENRDAAGNNETHATIGGFVETVDNYITAGSSTYQKSDESREWPIHNAYITVTPKNNFSESSTKLVWLTSYTENTNDVKMAGTPFVSKLSDNKICVIWSVGTGLHKTETLQYVFVDGEGSLISDVKTVKGKLSDCEPVLSSILGEDTLYWTVNTGSNVMLYSLTAAGKFSSKKATGFPSSMYVFPRKMNSSLDLYCNYIGSIPSGYCESDADRMIENRFSLYDKTFPGGERVLKFEEDFTTSGPSGLKIGGEWTSVGFLVTGMAPYYYGKYKYTSHAIPKSIQVDHIFYSSNAATVIWNDSCYGAMGYTIYRKIGKGSYKKIKTFKNTTKKRKWKYVDKKVKKTQKVSYRIIAYTKTKAGKKIYTSKKAAVSYPALVLNKSAVTLQPDKTFRLKVSGKISNKKVTYKTSNKKIAKVSSTGKITAVKSGVATITVTCGKQKGSCVVTVAGRSASQEKALRTFIDRARAYGASMIDDLYDETYYKWDKDGNLIYLVLSENGLKGGLEFSAFPKLETLYIDNSESVTGVDISSNTKLKNFALSYCDVKTLNLKNNVNLEELSLNNLNLQSLDIAGNTKLKNLYLNTVSLAQIDISHNIDLERLSLYGFDMHDFDVSRYTNLCALILVDCKLNGAFDFHGHGRLEEIDLSENTGLTNLNIKNCISLKYLTFKNTGLTEIDFTGCTSLDGFYSSDVEGSPISKLFFTGCSALKSFSYEEKYTGVSLTDIDFTRCSAVEEISLRPSVLSSINLHDCRALKRLYLAAQSSGVITAGEYGGAITKLDLSGCTELEYLNIDGNHIANLDLSGLTKLYRLHMYNCGTENIVFDSSGNSELEIIEAGVNPFHEIYAPNLPKLTTAYFTNCPDLIKVDISGSALISTITTDPGVEVVRP